MADPVRRSVMIPSATKSIRDTLTVESEGNGGTALVCESGGTARECLVGIIPPVANVLENWAVVLDSGIFDGGSVCKTLVL